MKDKQFIVGDIIGPGTLFSERTAAKYLGIGRDLFAAEVKPHLRGRKVGARLLYPRAELDRFSLGSVRVTIVA